MKRKKTRRFLAGLLLIVMIYTLPTAAAFADDTTDTPSETDDGSTAVTTYAITFEGGEGASGTAPTMYEIAADVTLILPDNTFTKADCTFVGWSDGTDTFDAGDEYTMPDHAVIFTAQWEAADDYTTTPAALAFTVLEAFERRICHNHLRDNLCRR